MRLYLSITLTAALLATNGALAQASPARPITLSPQDVAAIEDQLSALPIRDLQTVSPVFNFLNTRELAAQAEVSKPQVQTEPAKQKVAPARKAP